MNLNIWQIIFLALLQGITELFPISSLGQTVILPGLFGWGDLVRNKSFLPLIVATFLIVNGSLLFLGERMRLRAESQETKLSPKEREAHFRPLSSLTWKEALIVGLAQSLALIPGISRSGATMVAGLGVGLNHEDAARFSFLLGTPIIGAAALLEVPQLIGQPRSVLLLVMMGMVLAGVAAFLSTRFLLKYFENGRLNPFAYYCWGAGLLSLILLLTVLHTGA